jgi:hypothetical protein
MGKLLFTAMLALAVLPGLALGGDESSTPPARLHITGPVGQAASPLAPVSAEWVTPTGGVLDSKPAPDCGEPCAKADGVCGPPSCFWVRAEYLMWWIKGSDVPDLITTGTPGANVLPGVLGQPGTTGLFGGSLVDDQVRSGGRFSAGFWFCETTGVEGSYFFLASRSKRFDDASNGALGSAIIARPFFDVLAGIPNAQLVAFPGIASGQIHLSSFSRLQGAELNLLCIPCCTPCCTPCCDPCADQACPSGDTPKHRTRCNTFCGVDYWFDLLAGFRFLQLDEGLGITENSQVNAALPAGSPLFGGSTIDITDQFNTHNYFYGGQVGAQAEFCCGRAFVDVVGKVALGDSHQVVDIQGSTVITSPSGATVVTPSGFLASGSNSGHFTRDRFAVVPEVGINVGCQVTRHVRAFVGYTFVYCSSVVRPGDQVDVGLSGTQIPTDTRFNPQAGPARPAVVLRDTDFWAQGINFGMEFRY